MKYINRYSQIYTFELMPNGNISWKGPFRNYRTILNENKEITFLDPSGGPCIVKGQDMEFVNKTFSKMIVDKMLSRTNELDKSIWVEIVIEKK
jgi:hypothetical protein